jgi:hypothetical protein
MIHNEQRAQDLRGLVYLDTLDSSDVPAFSVDLRSYFVIVLRHEIQICPLQTKTGRVHQFPLAVPQPKPDT